MGFVSYPHLILLSSGQKFEATVVVKKFWELNKRVQSDPWTMLLSFKFYQFSPDHVVIKCCIYSAFSTLQVFIFGRKTKFSIKGRTNFVKKRVSCLRSFTGHNLPYTIIYKKTSMKRSDGLEKYYWNID